MIISRTPFRVSFFGGGTDYPAWYRENGGAVLGTSINKYCYITCRRLPPFFEHRHRIVYSQTELVREVSEIQHPAVRAALRFMDVRDGVEIHHDGDLPARTGLGSSSAFSVGILHALYALKGVMPSKMQLAREAIHLEQDLLRENVGCQDQVLAALGGLRLVTFNGSMDIKVQPVTIRPERLDVLQDHLMLFFTGFARTASEVAAEQIRETPNRKRELTEMRRMVDEAVNILNGEGDLADFGRLLDAGWKLKRSLTDRIATPQTEEVYRKAMAAGATGGKLLGAGGGGFMLFFVEPDIRQRVRQALEGLLYVPFRFERAGTQVVFYEPDPAEAAYADAPAYPPPDREPRPESSR